jgi:hypothetical protein
MQTPLAAESGTSAKRPPGPGAARESSWTDTDALAGIFSCSSAEMDVGLASSRPDAPLNERARSWVHEHLHLYHAITTPVGVFCNALRFVQTLATRDVLIHLRSAGIPPKVPLLRHVRDASPAVIASVRDPLTIWLDAELFLTHQQGSLAAYISMAAENPLTRGATMTEIFQRLQVGVARYLYLPGPDTERAAKELFGALVHEELVDPEQWQQEDRNSFAGAVLSAGLPGRPAWLPTVLESACHAVEMWGQSFDAFERLYAARHKDLNYLWPIAQTASTLRSRSLPEILATHLAVCDLALTAPIMPDRVAVRHGLRVNEMLPHTRFFSILNALENVGPLRRPDAYSAFTDAICEHLHWTRPEEIFATGSWRWPALGVRDELFRLAAEHRKAEPAIFITPFLSYDPEIGARFREQFTFHTLQFTDRVVYHRNKTWLYASQINFICNEWLHGVMAGVPKTVVLPWRTQADEPTFLAAEAQEIISKTLGWKVPPPRIVSAR